MNLFTGCGLCCWKQRHKHWPELTWSYLRVFFVFFPLCCGLNHTWGKMSLDSGRQQPPAYLQWNFWEEAGILAGSKGVAPEAASVWRTERLKQSKEPWWNVFLILHHGGAHCSLARRVPLCTSNIPAFPAAWMEPSEPPGSTCAWCWESSWTKDTLLLRSASKHQHNTPLIRHFGGI